MPCDAFVALPDVTSHGGVIFAKNSDRPSGEVQEVVVLPSGTHLPDSTVMCTYIEVPQVPNTLAVILSKPSWMWGAEMGANEAGVCIGNEAVWTKLNGEEDKEERLLGMDLLRLALERAHSAEEAVKTIGSLLEAHGQGGPCSDTEADFFYHNSFLIADYKEAWVLETADRFWVAKKYTSGVMNISNQLVIGSDFDLSSAEIQEKAKAAGLWDGTGAFDFKAVFQDPGHGAEAREKAGRKLMEDLAKTRGLSLETMSKILRNDMFCFGWHKDSQVPGGRSIGGFMTTGAQISVLSGSPGSGPTPRHVHWLTGTPDPTHSVFKPFIFVEGAEGSPFCVSPDVTNDPAKAKPRFARKVDRSHRLWELHSRALASGSFPLETMRSMETTCVNEIKENQASAGDADLKDLFKDLVLSEMKFYE